MVIQIGDSVPEVKQEIEDVVNYALGPGEGEDISSWLDATNRINASAAFLEREGITDQMPGAIARNRINALWGGPTWTPDEASLYIDFLNDRSWPPSSAWNLTRPTNATDDITGTLETYAPNVLRNPLGYGALLERAGVNLLTWSSDFGNAAWRKFEGGTGIAPQISANYAAAPDGTSTAQRIIFDKGAGGTQSDLSQLVGPTTLLPAGFCVYSMWVKLTPGAAPTTLRMSISGGGEVSITPTDQWQRFFAPWDAPANPWNTRLELRGDTLSSDYADVLVWGAQLETGPVATSYIPTEGAAASRAADLLTVPVQDGGRAFAFEFDLLEPLAGLRDRIILNWANGTSSRRCTLVISSSGPIFNVFGGPGSGTPVSTVEIASGRNVFYGTFANNWRRFGTVGKPETAIETNVGVPKGLNTLGIGYRGNSASSWPNTNIRARRFMEILNPPDPEAAFAQVRAIAEGWAA